MSQNIARAGGALRRELLVFALTLAVLLALVLFLADGLILFTRPLWLDEILTVLPARHSSPLTVIGDLRSGVDGGTGPFHLTVWALRVVVGSVPPALLRALALASVLGALCLTFVTLRHRFGADASAAGALAVGSNLLVVTHAFEARFYGPWLLCAAYVALSLQWLQRERSTRHALHVVLASILLATVHFYGIISLVVMCVGVAVSYGPRWRESLPLVRMALVPGVISVLAVLPLALGQRSAYSMRTWVPEFEARQLTGLLGDFWLAGIPLIGAAALGIAPLLAKRPARRRPGDIARETIGDAGVAALASHATMPFALAIVSLAGQPSMLSRYAIATVLAWGPWIAFCMESAGRAASRGFHFVVAWFWFVSVTKVVAEKQAFANLVSRNRATLASAAQLRLPIVFSSIHVMYPSASGANGADLRFIDLPDSIVRRLFPPGTELERLNRGTVIQRDLARVHARRLGFPALATQRELDSSRRFLLFAPAADLPKGYENAELFAQRLFRNHGVRPIHPDVMLLER